MKSLISEIQNESIKNQIIEQCMRTWIRINAEPNLIVNISMYNITISIIEHHVRMHMLPFVVEVV